MSHINIKELFFKEVEHLPESMLEEVWDFLL